MTTTRGLDRLSLHSPAALVAAIPYLIGFHPRASAVVVWLANDRVLLTQRLDLPPVDGTADQAWLRAMWTHTAAPQADELVVCTFDAPLPDALADALMSRADESDIAVRDLLCVEQGRWRSLLCGDPECCPAEGREVGPEERDAVAAEFTLQGCAPLASREELVSGLAFAGSDPVVGVALVAAARPGPAESDALEAWRDERIADILAALQPLDGARPPRRLLGAVIAGLADVRVRDTVLWEVLAWPGDRLPRAVAAILPAVQSAPPGSAAPVATCCAALSWLSGDGARALAALDRALVDDPTYSLARLLQASVTAGLPPAAWREALARLTRDACRWGVEPEPGA